MSNNNVLSAIYQNKRKDVSGVFESLLRLHMQVCPLQGWAVSPAVASRNILH